MQSEDATGCKGKHHPDAWSLLDDPAISVSGTCASHARRKYKGAPRVGTQLDGRRGSKNIVLGQELWSANQELDYPHIQVVRVARGGQLNAALGGGRG